MENQYNYYTTDQNMNTGNYGGGGEPGKEPQKKRGKDNNDQQCKTDNFNQQLNRNHKCNRGN